MTQNTSKSHISRDKLSHLQIISSFPIHKRNSEAAKEGRMTLSRVFGEDEIPTWGRGRGEICGKNVRVVGVGRECEGACRREGIGVMGRGRRRGDKEGVGRGCYVLGGGGKAG